MTTFDDLIELRRNATPGVWGPTTSAPTNEEGWFRLAHGERSDPSWGAVVSDTDFPRHGIDHIRFEPTATRWAEKGSDAYGGTLICESLADGNGEYIAALHNELPGLLATIHVLKTMLSAVVNPEMVEQTIRETLQDARPDTTKE